VGGTPLPNLTNAQKTGREKRTRTIKSLTKTGGKQEVWEKKPIIGRAKEGGEETSGSRTKGG